MKFWIVFSKDGKAQEETASLRHARQLIKNVYIGGFYRRGY